MNISIYSPLHESLPSTCSISFSQNLMGERSFTVRKDGPLYMIMVKSTGRYQRNQKSVSARGYQSVFNAESDIPRLKEHLVNHRASNFIKQEPDEMYELLAPPSASV